MTTRLELMPMDAFKKPIAEVSRRYDVSPAEMLFAAGKLIGE